MSFLFRYIVTVHRSIISSHLCSIPYRLERPHRLLKVSHARSMVSAAVSATPDHLPEPNKSTFSNNTSSDEHDHPAAVANGSPLAKAPSPPTANGKAMSPFGKESNPMGPAQTVSSKDPKAAAAAANDMRNVVRRKLTGYVGFANLPNQWHRKSVRKGFNFNVMVVGMYIHSTYSIRVLTRARRIRSRQIDPGQYPIQHVALSSSRTERAQSRHHPKDCVHPIYQRRY